MLNFFEGILNFLPNLIAFTMLMLIGLSIGGLSFLVVWFLAFLWRKIVISMLPGVYDWARPGRFAFLLGLAIAVFPIAVVTRQSIATVGLNIDFVPWFFRIWIFVIGALLIAAPIVFTRDFMKRKKPESGISESTVSD